MNEEKLKIGAYDPEAGNDIAFYYIDEYNLCLTRTGNKGVGDCIGRSMVAYLIYHDPKIVRGIDNCWQYLPEFNNKMVGIRHPEMHLSDGEFSEGFWERRMSRDHYIYTLVALRLWEQRNYYKLEKLEQIVKATPFGIRRMARWTLPLILWSKSLLKNNYTALWWYLILELIAINIIYRPMRWLGYKIAGWKEEVDQEDWNWLFDTDPNAQSNKWKNEHLLQSQSWLNRKISKIVFPSYAIQFAAFQLYVTSNKYPKLKKKLQNSLLKMVGETNYVQQMLLGKKDIPREKIEAYKSMYGNRWSGHLNGRNDRHLAVMPEDKFTVNQLDVDLVRYLYNETQLG